MMARLFLVGVVVVAGACSKSDSSGEGGKPAAKGGAPTTVSLDTLGLKADVPGGSKVEKSIMGDGQMIQGPDLRRPAPPARPTRSPPARA